MLNPMMKIAMNRRTSKNTSVGLLCILVFYSLYYRIVSMVLFVLLYLSLGLLCILVLYGL